MLGKKKKKKKPQRQGWIFNKKNLKIVFVY
jgi:hypothetical protein